MTNYYGRSDSPEWDHSFGYYEEEVLSEELVDEGSREDQIWHNPYIGGHPFDESTTASLLFPEENKAEIDICQQQVDPPESARYDRLEPAGQLRLGTRSPYEYTGAKRSGTPPVLVQRPVLLPQEQSSSSSTEMPQEQPSSATSTALQAQPSAITRRQNQDLPSSIVGKQAPAVAPTLVSSVVDIEEDYPFLENQIVCYRGNEIVPYAAPQYLDGIDTKDKFSWRLTACLLLLLFLVIALAVVVSILYFVAYKAGDASNRVPTMSPTVAYTGGPADPSYFTVECSGRVATLTDESVTRYETLTRDYIVPNVYTSWDHNIDSCHPANQAVVWLSTGSTDEADWLQRYLMALTYFSTEGATWSFQDKWLSEENVCDWEGLGCTSQGDIVKINLADNGLAGPLISELGLLQKLQVVTFQKNALSGSIPTEITNLPDLNIVNLSRNRLIGQINISTPNLELLDLSGNSLTGPIAPELGQATLLKTLDLGFNLFSQTLPTELNKLTKLSFLNIETNAQITGRIPTEFGLFTDLYFLSISNTGIRARIPRQYRALTNLEELRIANTLVGGDIPDGVAYMTRLSHMDLSGSRFRKPLPSIIGALSKLTHLSVHNNSLTGAVPSELGKLTDLLFLSLDDNELSGSIPSELGDLSKLETLTLHGNDLITGRVPDELCGLRENSLEVFTTSCPSRDEQGNQLGVTCAVPLCCSACIGLLG